MDSQALTGPGVCPTPVARAAMVQWWEQLTFVHWRYRADEIQPLLPEGLEVETCDGSAWVGLVPFFLRVGLPRVPSVPWVSRFAETNVRTYVRGADGRSGVWFFSLDAARLGAVLVARATYRIPYFWSQVRVDHDGDAIRYQCRRRWPGPRGARSRLIVEPGEVYSATELTALDHFLTARWGLFSAPRSGLHYAEASHDPWPLHRARIVELEDELVAADGLPPPRGETLVHYSPSVEVRIGWPDEVRPA